MAKLDKVGVRKVVQHGYLKWQAPGPVGFILAEHLRRDGGDGVRVRLAFVDDHQFTLVATDGVALGLALLESEVAFDLKLVGDQLAEQHENQPGVRHENADLFPGKRKPLEVRREQIDQQRDAQEVTADERKLEHHRVAGRPHVVTEGVPLLHHCSSVAGDLVKPRLRQRAICDGVNDAQRRGRFAVARAVHLDEPPGVAVHRERLELRFRDFSEAELTAPTVDILGHSAGILGQLGHRDGRPLAVVFRLKIEQADLRALDFVPMPRRHPLRTADPDLRPARAADAFRHEKIATEIFFLRVVKPLIHLRQRADKHQHQRPDEAGHGQA